MFRKFIQDLNLWSERSDRKPLILRGARQVGKTHCVREFAKLRYRNFVEVNFELQPQIKKVFNTLDAHDLVRNLSLVLGVNISAEDTLLFFDEIQECPEAIRSLRYFYEMMPKLAVIGAGSLLDFTIDAADFRMPVGRVEYMHLKPMLFSEHLLARGQDQLVNFLDELSIQSEINPAIHDRLIGLFRNYLLVGGMPQAVLSHVEHPERLDYQDVQLVLLQTYRDDFGKYSSRARLDDLHKVYDSAPSMVSQTYKYAQVDRDAPTVNIKQAFQMLVKAGVVTQVLATSAHGLPLLKDANPKKFKLLFLDVGMMQRACGLSGEIALSQDFLAINSGAVVEQFVGQHLLAQRNPRETPGMFYWAREAQGSQAEVDFLLQVDSRIFPVEVKSGKGTTLKSLNLFLQMHPKSPLGIRLSQHPLSLHGQLLSIPLYAVEQTARLVRESLVKLKVK